MRTIWFLIQLVLVVLAFYQPWPFFFVMCAVEGVYGLCLIVREELAKAINPPPIAPDDIWDVVSFERYVRQCDRAAKAPPPAPPANSNLTNLA